MLLHSTGMEYEWATSNMESCTRNADRVIFGIRKDEYQNIVFCVGAGISVAAGFSTFRESKNSNVSNDLSVDAHPARIAGALCSILVDDAQPTDFHRLMHAKAKYIFTQNIDGLEVDDGRTTWCHGKLQDGAFCKSCKKHMPWSVYKEKLPIIYFWCECGGDIRPNIVLYGEPASFDFQDAAQKVSDADLVIFAGTSLEVYPFKNLISHVSGELMVVEPHPTLNHFQRLNGGRTHLFQGDCQVFAKKCLSSLIFETPTIEPDEDETTCAE